MFYLNEVKILNCRQCILPENLREIDEEAFSRCSNLKTVSFNSNLKEIEEKAFAFCSSLDNIKLPGSLTEVPEKCFLACSGLTKVEISEGTKKLEEDAFRNCPNLKEVNLPQSIIKIDPDTFDRNNTLKITAPSGSYASRFAQENGYSESSQEPVPETPTNITLKDLDIINDHINLAVGADETIRLKFSPANATNKNVTYNSLNPEIAQVDPNGLVSAISPGKTRIIVFSEDGNHSDDCEVLVLNQNSLDPSPESVKVRDIKLNRDDIHLEIGETFKLEASIFPKEAEGTQLIWFSNNPNVAKVDDTGLVTAVGDGKAEIEVSTLDGRVDEDCDIRVGSNLNQSGTTKVEKVKLDRDDLFMTPGEIVALNARIIPADATNKSVFWISSNTNVATVDQSGKVTAIGVGKAEIEVITEDGHHDDDCDIIVYGKDQSQTGSPEIFSVRDIDIDDDLYLDIGSTYQLNIKISPSNATNQAVSFKSLDPKVAEVDANGLITAIGNGRTKIIATTADGNHEDSCDVIIGGTRDPGVSDTIPLRDIDIDDDLIMYVGDSTNLTVRFSPQDATNKNITWNSLTPEIISVDESGKITALKAGFGKVQVISEDGNLEDDCDVVVNEKTTSPAVENIILNSTSAELLTGETLSLGAKVIPSSSNQTVLWSSSNPDIIKVDMNGNLQALKAGSANISAQNASRDITANCLITVTDINDMNIQNESLSISYTVHLQDYGWISEVKDGILAGSTGESKRLEGIKIHLGNDLNGLRYKTHVQDIGWQDWKNSNELSGTTGESKRLEAIQIELLDELAQKYDIYYRVHCQNIGWLNWAKNGSPSGSAGFGQRLEAIQIKVVPKGDSVPVCNPINNSELSFVEK